MILAVGPLAGDDQKGFPALGKTYDVVFAETARHGRAQIKILSKGDGTWILVEFKLRDARIIPRPAASKTPQTPQTPPVVNKMDPERLWINTQWIVSASELESEKE